MSELLGEWLSELLGEWFVLRPLLVMGLFLLHNLEHSLQSQLVFFLHLGPRLNVQFVLLEHHQPDSHRQHHPLRGHLFHGVELDPSSSSSTSRTPAVSTWGARLPSTPSIIKVGDCSFGMLGKGSSATRGTGTYTSSGSERIYCVSSVGISFQEPIRKFF